MKILKSRFHTWKFSTFVVDSDADAKRIIEKLLKNTEKIYGLDIETAKLPRFVAHGKAGLDPRLSRIRLLQIYDRHQVFVFDLFRVDILSFRDLFRKGKFIAHNAKFELAHIRHAGLELPNLDCSMIMATLVDHAEFSPFEKSEEDEDEPQDGLGKYRMRGVSLDAVISREFGVSVPKELQGSDWGAKKLSASQYRYAALDAVLTYEAGKKLYGRIKTYKMGAIYDLLKKLQHVIVEMESNGMPVDWKEHARLMKLWAVAEKKALAHTKKYFGSLNLNSPKQLGEWLERRVFRVKPALRTVWPRNKSGKGWSFNKFHIKKFEGSPPIAALLEYKRVSKLIGTYGKSLLEKKHPVTGRLHCSMSATTATGRLAARDPNLQQLPRTPKDLDLFGDMRDVFRVPRGALLLVADFSQIEMRTAGEVSRDPVMLKAFKDGVDLHALIVSRVLGIPIENVSGEQRQQGKPINFGYAFGMGWRKFRDYAANSYGVHFTPLEARRSYETYHALYRVYSRWCKDQRTRCERAGAVRTPMGKLRKLEPDEIYTKAVNTPVQGGAAEVMFWSLVILYDTIKLCRLPCKILMSIHDEIVVEVTDTSAGSLERCKIELEVAMERGMQKVFPTAAIKGIAEAHEGESWAIAKKGPTKPAMKKAA